MDPNGVYCFFDEFRPCGIVAVKIIEIFPNTSENHKICDKVECFTNGVSQTPCSKSVFFGIGIPYEETISSH